MEDLLIMAAVWAFVALFWFLLSLVLLLCSELLTDKRRFSRGIFLAPVWPLVILYGIWLGLAELWYMTDWDIQDLKRKS